MQGGEVGKETALEIVLAALEIGSAENLVVTVHLLVLLEGEVAEEVGKETVLLEKSFEVAL